VPSLVTGSTQMLGIMISTTLQSLKGKHRTKTRYLSGMTTMPRKRFGRRQLVLVVISLLDDVIIATVLILILSHFIRVPVWVVVVVAVMLATWATVSFLAVRRNPQLGFENMIGATGLAIEPLSPRGTIKIGHESWAAKASTGPIAAGSDVLVVGQNGLLLIVIRKDQSQVNETPKPGPAIEPKVNR